MVKSATSGSARTRDSIYMHLDNIPVALRDVSNHWSPGGCENPTELDTKPVRRRRVRLKKSPCKVASHKCNAVLAPSVPTITGVEPPQSEVNENKKDVVCER